MLAILIAATNDGVPYKDYDSVFVNYNIDGTAFVQRNKQDLGNMAARGWLISSKTYKLLNPFIGSLEGNKAIDLGDFTERTKMLHEIATMIGLLRTEIALRKLLCKPAWYKCESRYLAETSIKKESIQNKEEIINTM